jgi:translation elongation factor EF-G
MMGRGLEPLEEVPAGNIFGLAGVDDHILKTATLCSSPMCMPMLSVQFVSSSTLFLRLQLTRELLYLSHSLLYALRWNPEILEICSS